MAMETPQESLIRNLSLWASGLLALTAWLTTAGGTFATLFLLAALFYLFSRPSFRRDPMVVVAVIWAIYIVARTLYPDSGAQDTLAARWHDAGSWLQLTAFLPVAWFVRGNTRYITAILLTALTGLMLGLLFKSHWSEILNGPLRNRTGFHLTIAYSGFIHSVAILGLILFARRIFANPGRLLRLGWVSLLVISTWAILVSQSRQTWLMDIILIPVAVGCCRLLKIHASLPSVRQAVWPGVLATSLILGLISVDHKLILKRVHEEKTVVDSIITHERAGEIPKTSFGYRYNVLVFGYQKWLEKPWIGWGAGSSKYFIEHSGNPLLIYQEPGKPTIWLRHFHNLYLEILIRFGLVGMICCATIAFMMVQSLLRAYRAGLVPTDYLVFFLGGFAMMGLYSLFGFPLLHPDGRSFVILFAGLAYSFRYHPAFLPPSAVE